MISRRNIRVKVMQTLYTLATSEPGVQDLAKNGKSGLLDDKLNRSLDIFTICILYIVRIAQYADTDSANRSSKYLATDEDKNVNTSILQNDLVLQLTANKSLEDKIKKAGLEQFIDTEWVKKIYRDFVQTPEYKEYTSVEKHTPKEDRAILHFLWSKVMLENEALLESFAEELQGWEDDKEMTLVLIDNFFKNNTAIDFSDLISDEKREYAHALMQTVLEKEEYCMELIYPKLKNWDTERIALIDLLLLRMGVCEMLYFPTIPAKVTINEYIEVGKMYSTLQSGQFINGVLDNIRKDLEKDDLIKKQERPRKS